MGLAITFLIANIPFYIWVTKEAIKSSKAKKRRRPRMPLDSWADIDYVDHTTQGDNHGNT